MNSILMLVSLSLMYMLMNMMSRQEEWAAIALGAQR